MKKKVLLISASAGSGHVRAAQALEQTAQQFFSTAMEVTHIDMMEYVALPVKTAIKSYDIMVKQMPELWGFLYKKSDNIERMDQFRKLTNVLNRINATKLYTYVAEYKPDVIVCTHFLPAQALFAAPEKYKVSAPICMVMTDYDKHNLLMMDGLAHYFVATEKMKHKMVYEGIAQDDISVTGIPVDPLFYEPINKQALQKSHHIPENQPVILVLSGGYGLAHTDEIIPALFELKQPTTIIAIAGHNKALLKSLEELDAPSHITLNAIGWTDAIHEYMTLADAIVTKPGGLTTSECIALGKPIIAIQPIPGQEEQNAEFILENGHGVIAHSRHDVLYYAEQAIQKTEKKERPPMAAKRILKKVLAV